MCAGYFSENSSPHELVQTIREQFIEAVLKAISALVKSVSIYALVFVGKSNICFEARGLVFGLKRLNVFS